MPSAGCWWYWPLAWSVVLACYAPTVIDGDRLTETEVVQAALAAGFDDEQAAAMTDIAWCESGFDPTLKYQTSREDSRGLWQINRMAWPGLYAEYDWRDPFDNGRMAKTVFDVQGYRAWLNCARKNGLA